MASPSICGGSRRPRARPWWGDRVGDPIALGVGLRFRVLASRVNVDSLVPHKIPSSLVVTSRMTAEPIIRRREIKLFLRLRIVEGQWLFAKNLLACFGNFEGGRIVGVVRRDVGDRVELSPRQPFGQAPECTVYFMTLTECLGPRLINVYACHDGHTVDRGETLGMLSRHRTCAQNCNLRRD